MKLRSFAFLLAMVAACWCTAARPAFSQHTTTPQGYPAYPSAQIVLNNMCCYTCEGVAQGYLTTDNIFHRISAQFNACGFFAETTYSACVGATNLPLSSVSVIYNGPCDSQDCEFFEGIICYKHNGTYGTYYLECGNTGTVESNGPSGTIQLKVTAGGSSGIPAGSTLVGLSFENGVYEGTTCASLYQVELNNKVVSFSPATESTYCCY